ncbi:BQ5605_C022g09472 [Microbotryum silenes-dioicae]|uniref:BQ5605_C022g09472 protein n=1 Tax=Microbotryum silenes-dioicae TaxID=796604 RepID=A0A2X0PEI4_9BASI|nr:BQ5605_C022g09472 [Microbotryum silenes-dioicae]
MSASGSASSSRTASPVRAAPREARPPPPVDTTRLLDDSFGLSEPFCQVLSQVFHKYASMTSLPPAPLTEGVSLPDPEEPEQETLKGQPTLGRAQLNAFAKDTNGQVMDDETYKEIAEFLTCTTGVDGAPALTFKGFVQLYQLQTENDINETWNDLTQWGYDRNLQLVGNNAPASATSTETPAATNGTTPTLGEEA